MASITDIIDKVFTRPPYPPCTFSLVFQEDIPVFQTLMTILISGAKRLYGESITPSEISDRQFLELQRYMESLGYHVKYNYRNVATATTTTTTTATTTTTTEPEPDEPIRIINIWFEPYFQKTDCSGRPTVI